MNSGKSFGRVVAAVVLVAVLCASCVTTVPMTDGEPVDVEKVFMGSAYYQDEEQLNVATMIPVLESYDENDRYMGQYRRRQIGAGVLNLAGSLFLIGGAVATLSDDWFLALGFDLWALLMYGVSIPFSVGATRSLDKAVDVYNTDVVEVE